ncbi:MAG: phage baseplate assembly protein [Conexibacter sp.]|nr:phage baseplate assembly protein [Solirubrobacterales bacterium]MCW3004792.1 phage baseplate assembly protein [Conexibacter sp.]
MSAAAVGGSLLGTGLAFPFGPGPQRSIGLVSDGEDIAQAVRLVLATAPGERVMRPEFGCGIHQFVFESVDVSTVGRMDRVIRQALHRWEPRIEVVEVRIEPEATDDGAQVLLIQLSYRILATMTLRNLVYPFYLVPAEGTGA